MRFNRGQRRGCLCWSGSIGRTLSETRAFTEVLHWLKRGRCWVLLAGFALWAAGARADSSLVFNEVMYHPATNEPSMEWVELHNQLAVDLDASGWSLDGDIHYVFSEGTVVPGGGYLVVAISPTNLTAATGLSNVFGPFTGRLGNGGGVLRVRNNNGREVSELKYGTDNDWPVAPDGSGVSLARKAEDLSCEVSESWTWSEQTGGTPGRANFPAGYNQAPLGVVFNEIANPTNTEFFVELLNAGTNSAALGGLIVRKDGTNDASYVLPAGSLAKGALLNLPESSLGFRPVAGDRLYLFAAGGSKVLDAVDVRSKGRGRQPSGPLAAARNIPGDWLNTTSSTPGAANNFSLSTNLVINEIMYHHQMLPGTNGAAWQDSPEEWVEVYNRGSAAADLAGWQLKGGISYSFPTGQTLLPGGYVVVAKDAPSLRLAYPAITILGNFSGSLNNSGDAVQLEDPAGNPADKVRYYTSGRWPEYADGDGSSLELLDPQAENSAPEAWGASDETGKSAWQLYSYTMVASASGGPDDQWKDFVLGLLAPGECLIDNLSVVESPTGAAVEMLANGDFESGASGWRFVGNHIGSRVEVDPDNAANHVLHVVSTGQQEHVSNHIETTLQRPQGIANGRTYAVSFRAKWLGGSRLLNTRAYFNRLAKTTALAAPQLNGTPGAPNSRLLPNAGPSFSFLRHNPAVPVAKQPVDVRIVAEDPQGVASATLYYSVNGAAFSSVAMVPEPGSGGAFGQRQVALKGTVPGRGGGALVQFYVQAADGLGAIARFPARGSAGGAFFMVNDGEADLALGHNYRLLLKPSDWALLRAPTNLMSSAQVPATLIWNETRPYYDIGIRLKGSPMGRYGDQRPSFHVEFQPDDPFLGVHRVLLLDGSGRPGHRDQQAEIVAHHMLQRAGGMPFPQTDMGWCMALYSTNTGPIVVMPRHEDDFIRTAFPDGADGTQWLMELIYFPTLDNAYGYKLVQDTGLIGTDLAYQGTDPEDYRYHFILKNNLAADDYTRLFPFLATMSLPNGPVLQDRARAVMDLDEWLRVFTFVSLTGEADWYTFSNPHNFFIYCRPGDNRMVALPWDIEQLFMRPSDAPLIGTANSYFTDLETFPANQRRMYAHALDMFASAYNSTYMTRWVSHYATFAPGQDFSETLSYINSRRAAILAEINAEGGNAPFAVTGQSFVSAGRNLVQITGTAPVQVQTLRINGVDYPVTWLSISNWSVTVPVTSPSTTFTITAFDFKGLLLPDSRIVTVDFTGSAAPAEGNLLINEIGWNPALPGAEFVEIYNRSTNTTFDLSNWRVQGVDYDFPPGTLITNGGYLVLARDANAYVAVFGPQKPLFGTFPGTLSISGEKLRLMRPPGPGETQPVSICQLLYSATAPWPATAPGQSLQLIDKLQDPSRAANWASAAPTPGAANSVAATLTAFPTLWLNEIQAENLTGITNRFGNRTPWIELYNPGTNTITLRGLYLASSFTNYTEWQFPVGASIGPGQFKVVFADGQGALSTASELHTTFALAPGVGTLALSRLVSGKSQVLDYLVYTNLQPNRSYGALPDGQGVDRLEFTYVSAGTNNIGNSAPLTVVINEWMAGNTNTIRDPVTGRFEDWFELYNYGTNSANLAGYFLTHSLTNQFEFQIPPGYVIPPGGFLLVWADKKSTNGTPDLHVNFKLSKTGTSIGLYGADGLPIDYVTFGAQTSNISMGRYPDGAAAQFFMTAPSPGTNNIVPNTAPVIAPIGTKYLYDGQTLRFTVVATDAEAPWQTLSFGLQPGAPDGSSVAATTGVFLWTPQGVDAPSTNWFSVSVTDDGVPPLSDARSFSVIMVGPPQLTGAPRPSGDVPLSFQTVPGMLYQLEFKDALQDPFWTPIGSAIPGTGAVVQIQDPDPSSVRRFYRLVVSAGS